MTDGQKLRARRERAGLTQDQFAVIAPISVAGLRRYETEKQLGGTKWLRVQRAMLNIMIEQMVPTADQLAAHMGVTVGSARRIISGGEVGLELTEKTLDALDDIAAGVELPDDTRFREVQ